MNLCLGNQGNSIPTIMMKHLPEPRATGVEYDKKKRKDGYKRIEASDANLDPLKFSQSSKFFQDSIDLRGHVC